jgi:hypothetical protein
VGLVLHPSQDTFKYEVNIKPCRETVTKREALALISYIFDPTGLLGPATARYKIYIQRLWLRKVGWDEELPHDLQETWKKLYRQLPALNDISIPKFVKIKGDVTTIQIHGFFDASERAFGVCVYIRSGDTNGELRSQLLCSKSRVSPVKQVSIPSLELCVPQLLARLIRKVLTILCIAIDSVHQWTDSMLVLTWLQNVPTRWTTYVANRVSEGNYLFQLNVHFLMLLESFLLLAQHVSNLTEPIIRSTTVVNAAICFPFVVFHSLRLVLVFCHITVSLSMLDYNIRV